MSFADAAASASAAGAPVQAAGALPQDLLPQDDLVPQIQQAPLVNGAPDSPLETSLDKYYRVKAETDAAAQSAKTSGSWITTGGLSTFQGDGTVGSKIIAAAEHYLGTMYKWGGTGPGGVDCSGLVLAAYKAAGIDLPRVSFEQANAGTRVASMKDLRPGDLVAWDNSSRNNGADHIAIYLGNGKIIEAARPGVPVRIRSLGKNEKPWFIRMGW